MSREEALRTILFHESESWRSNQNLHHDDWRDAIGKTLREFERSVLERAAQAADEVRIELQRDANAIVNDYEGSAAGCNAAEALDLQAAGAATVRIRLQKLAEEL